MPPQQSGELIVRSSWRLDAFASGFGAVFWGMVFLILAWLVAGSEDQLGSWLSVFNQLPVPIRVSALTIIGVGLLGVGALEIVRSLRPVVAILDRDAVSFPTLFGWRRLPWTDVIRVSLIKDRLLTFEIKREGDGRHERKALDLSRVATSREAVARRLASIRPDLADDWATPAAPFDPLRQERDFGHHFWS